MTQPTMSERDFCRTDTCAACGLCPKCGHIDSSAQCEVHLDVCGCPADKPHLICSSCNAKRIAFILTCVPEDGKWWKK
jgi:hypothetical protein